MAAIKLRLCLRLVKLVIFASGFGSGLLFGLFRFKGATGGCWPGLLPAWCLDRASALGPSESAFQVVHPQPGSPVPADRTRGPGRRLGALRFVVIMQIGWATPGGGTSFVPNPDTSPGPPAPPTELDGHIDRTRWLFLPNSANTVHTGRADYQIPACQLGARSMEAPSWKTGSISSGSLPSRGGAPSSWSTSRSTAVAVTLGTSES